jgi:gliding motility-associated-like protein
MACNSYTWIDGNTYTSSNNTAAHTIPNGSVSGCDSVVTLDLTINTPTSGTDVQVACTSYTWPLNGTVYTANTNTPTVTLTNAAGCDSVVTLDLTINTPASGTDVQVACTSYTWIDGNTYTSSNNTSTHTIPNGSVNGCDSVLILNLTITTTVVPIFDPVEPICSGDALNVLPSTSMNGINGNWSPAADNTVTTTYTFTPNTGQCASITTLTITVNPVYNMNENVDACEGAIYTYPDGSTATITANTSYTSNLITEPGCDSIIVTNVTMISNPIAAFTFSYESAYGTYTDVEFINNSIGADYYEWNFGDGSVLSDLENPIHSYLGSADQYHVTLNVASNNGLCTDSVDTYITIDDPLIYYVPNAFTPDGDEYNNTFTPVFTSGFDPYDYHLTVFNRWGEIVFESYNASIGWDGTYRSRGELCQDGVYVWRIEFKETKSDKRIAEQGHVALLK